jgi:hypothetical protein
VRREPLARLAQQVGEHQMAVRALGRGHRGRAEVVGVALLLADSLGGERVEKLRRPTVARVRMRLEATLLDSLCKGRDGTHHFRLPPGREPR